MPRLLADVPVSVVASEGAPLSVAAAEKKVWEVKAGEKLAVIEAMKMENVLRAEADGVVKEVRAAMGDTLAVDQAILEFK